MKKIIGLSLIALGVFLEVMWLGFCFGSVIIGILLLIFAPSILFFPFSFFLVLGLRFMGDAAYVRYTSSGSGRRQYKSNYFKQTVSMESYYTILESNKEDDFETIKKNYRRLMKEYHYDSVASQDLSAETLKEYEKKTQDINEAYSAIKKARN